MSASGGDIIPNEVRTTHFIEVLENNFRPVALVEGIGIAKDAYVGEVGDELVEDLEIHFALNAALVLVAVLEQLV